MRRAASALLILMAMTAAAHARPDVVIDPGMVDPATLRAVHEAVDVIVRQADDQDGGESTRLRRRARDAVLSALATQGYFNAQVTLVPGNDIAGETWDISIDAGERARVTGVDLEFTGRVALPAYAARVAELRQEWLLPPGKYFTNDDWNKAKAGLLDELSARDFLLARMVSSSADVDAANATVRIKVVMDSGPLVRMGPLITRGLKRVPQELVQRYVNYRPGQPYNQELLNQWQQELQQTAFFRGAFVSLQRPGQDLAEVGTSTTRPPARAPGADAPAGDPRVAGGVRTPPPPVDNRGEITLPVVVRLVEAAPKRLSSSLNIDTDSGVGVEMFYRQNIVFGRPLSLETGFGVDRLRQRAFLDFLLPPDARGNKDSFGLLAEHSDIRGLDLTRFAVGATRLREWDAGGDSRVDYVTRYSLIAAHDHVKIDGGDTYDLPTVMAAGEWLRRDVDSKYDPREGNLISLGGGVGVALDTGKPFTRLRARGQKWWPVGQRDVFTVRAEAGKVWADADTRVPDDFGFRTGGARSIRGYRYRSIGAHRDDAVVGAALLMVGSVEYDHYLNDRWGVGFFVDGGDAADSVHDMKLHLSYGVGARLRTPAGPLFLDVAYAQRSHALRLNFSLGIAF